MGVFLFAIVQQSSGLGCGKFLLSSASAALLGNAGGAAAAGSGLHRLIESDVAIDFRLPSIRLSSQFTSVLRVCESGEG
jgi:hypothetical protein